MRKYKVNEKNKNKQGGGKNEQGTGKKVNS